MECVYVHFVLVGMYGTLCICGGVRSDSDKDGQREEDGTWSAGESILEV